MSKLCANPVDINQSEQCCLTMGGCPTGQTYPPPRQTKLNERRNDLDPSLAYDVSEFGHLGYKSELGPPNLNQPIQNQYSGTWSMWQVTEDHHALAKFLADKVVQHIESSQN